LAALLPSSLFSTLVLLLPPTRSPSVETAAGGKRKTVEEAAQCPNMRSTRQSSDLSDTVINETTSDTINFEIMARHEPLQSISTRFATNASK